MKTKKGPGGAAAAKEEPLYKRYQSFGAGAEDRTSQEEAEAMKRLANSKSSGGGGGGGGMPKSGSGGALAAALDTHLERAAQYVFFDCLCGRDALSDIGPPDPERDKPAELRDKTMYQRALQSYRVLEVFLAQRTSALTARIATHALKDAHERVRALHERVRTQPMMRAVSVLRHEKGSVAAERIDAISDTPVAMHASYMELHFGDSVGGDPVCVTRDDHLHLSALHVAYHFWSYVLEAAVEQDALDNYPNPEDVSYFHRWLDWAGPPLPAADAWNYMRATTAFRKRLIHLRAALEGALSEQ